MLTFSPKMFFVLPILGMVSVLHRNMVSETVASMPLIKAPPQIRQMQGSFLPKVGCF